MKFAYCFRGRWYPPSASLLTGAAHLGLAGIAAATERIKLLTYLAVLPYRNPFHLAKAASTLDVKSEFAALGIDFDERNALFDESKDILAQAWTGEPVTHEGRHFSARGTVMQPRPIQVPGPPIWLPRSKTR
jgi:alkanesulfonate monooxygenase SsuD/methylene tetrahydromethanopterin reductase-like flavin-dependent oxidoreductase (luciferase family)